MASTGGSVVNNPPANGGATGDPGSIPWPGRSPGEGNGNPLQYSCGKSHGQRSLMQSVGLKRVRFDLATEHARKFLSGLFVVDDDFFS